MRLRALASMAGIVAIVVVALTDGAEGHGFSGARWTSARAEATIAAATWADHRIVIGQTCVGVDPVVRGTTEISAHFACRLNIYLRPATVPPGRWDTMAAAFRRHDIATVYALLGVPVGSSATTVQAAAEKWGLKNVRAVAVGVTIRSASSWAASPSAIPVGSFNLALQQRRELLAAIPAVEAYYADHGSYAGVSVAKLRKIDSNESALLRIVVATKTNYCVQLGTPTWFERGPGGAPTLGHC
jgi:hypothetical protein